MLCDAARSINPFNNVAFFATGSIESDCDARIPREAFLVDLSATQIRGVLRMSEQERPSGTSSSTWIIIGVIGLVVGGGCLVACLGVIGGFALPMRQAQRQAVEAEAVRQQAVEEAKRLQAESAKDQQHIENAEAQDRAERDALDAAQQNQPGATPDGTDEASPEEPREESETPNGEAEEVPQQPRTVGTR
jgi:hypothetical protein